MGYFDAAYFDNYFDIGSAVPTVVSGGSPLYGGPPVPYINPRPRLRDIYVAQTTLEMIAAAKATADEEDAVVALLLTEV